jgi:hypothetical protein
MTTPETYLAPRAKSLLIVAIATCALAIATLGTAAEKASAYWVCGPNYAVVRGADFRCQHGTWRSTIAYVEKLSSPRAYAVYRSSSHGGSSVSGSEYYSSTSDYFLQDFHCASGYPNAHNRHSVNVTVHYTHAASC